MTEKCTTCGKKDLAFVKAQIEKIEAKTLDKTCEHDMRFSLEDECNICLKCGFVYY